jgi:hypothetical protein
MLNKYHLQDIAHFYFGVLNLGSMCCTGITGCSAPCQYKHQGHGNKDRCDRRAFQIECPALIYRYIARPRDHQGL